MFIEIIFVLYFSLKLALSLLALVLLAVTMLWRMLALMLESLTRRWCGPPVLGLCIRHAQPEPRCHRGRTEPKPAWAIEFVLAHYRYRTHGYGKTAQLFNQQYGHLGHHMSGSTVRKYVLHTEQRYQAAYKRWHHNIPKHEPANKQWCLDATGKLDALSKQHGIFGVMDRGMRACLHLARMPHESTSAILAVLRQLVKQYGKPERITTDNAAVYTSAEFAAALAKMGIKHVRNRVASPWQNRIERMFGTLKEKLKCIELHDGAHLDALLPDWLTWYNHVRPHQHLYGWTPAQAWQGVNPFTSKPTKLTRFHAWDGLLTGFLIERERC